MRGQSEAFAMGKKAFNQVIGGAGAASSSNVGLQSSQIGDGRFDEPDPVGAQGLLSGQESRPDGGRVRHRFHTGPDSIDATGHGFAQPALQLIGRTAFESVEGRP